MVGAVIKGYHILLRGNKETLVDDTDDTKYKGITYMYKILAKQLTMN